MTDSLAELTTQIFQFWFGQSALDQPIVFKQSWYDPEPGFDEQVAERFALDYQQAASGTLAPLLRSPAGCVALVLLLDQFPRNMFRGTARAFTTHEQARAVTRHAIKNEFDTGLSLYPRMFLYMPLEHSESLTDQDDSVSLFRALGAEDQLDHARRQHEIIAEFGRFPQRNEAVGRDSTPAERAFLEREDASV